MKSFRGGYDIPLAGRPSGDVQVLPEPQRLYLPLRSRRFAFTEVWAKEGKRVQPGDVLARDPENYSVPLLAPRVGTVRLEAAAGHVVLEDLADSPEEPYDEQKYAPHVPHGVGSSGIKRYKLMMLGAWQFLEDACTGAMPDPFSTPRATIISTVRLEPFGVRGDVQLHKRLTSFTRGLEHLQAMVEYQPIFLALPDIQSEFARQVRQTIRGYAWVSVIPVPLRYPFDNFALLARSLGLDPSGEGPIWAMRTEGVLAIDRALTQSLPCTVRIVSVGGPAAGNRRHMKVVAGYPLEAIRQAAGVEAPARMIDGGVLTGETISDACLGLGSESSGLTVLAEHTSRELFGFLRPGGDRHSWSRCFLSSLRGPFKERMTTAMRGELRPCVACGSCEDVCPAGIMPHRIHKLLYEDELERIERAGVSLCVACGLCSYLCPSKIELRQEMLTAQESVERELHAPVEEEAPA